MEMGIQSFQYIGRPWFPACAGKTPFYGFIKIGSIYSMGKALALPAKAYRLFADFIV
jgi:hypothetical protein